MFISDPLDAIIIIGGLFIVATIIAFPHLPWKDLAIDSIKGVLPIVVAILLVLFITAFMWGIVGWQNFTPSWLRVTLTILAISSLVIFFKKKYN